MRFKMLLVPPALAFSLFAVNDAPSTSRVTELYKRALLADNFAGAQIENVLLGDPEGHGSEYRYSSEFTVRDNGKTRHCEDWHFRLSKAQGAWYVSEVVKGRCSG